MRRHCRNAVPHNQGRRTTAQKDEISNDTQQGYPVGVTGRRHGPREAPIGRHAEREPDRQLSAGEARTKEFRGTEPSAASE